MELDESLNGIKLLCHMERH